MWNKLKDSIQSYLIDNIEVLTNEGVLPLGNNDNKQSFIKNKLSFVKALVIPAKYLRQKSAFFPFVNLSELKNAIELYKLTEFNDPKNTLHFINSKETDGTKVTFWEVQDSIYKQYSNRYTFFLPEPLVAIYCDTGNLVYIDTPLNQYYVSILDGQSSLFYKTPLFKDVAQYALALGLSGRDVEVQVVDNTNYMQSLKETVHKLGFESLLGLKVSGSKNIKKLSINDIIKSIMMLILGCGIVISIQSAYLIMERDSVSKDLKENKLLVTEYLDAKFDFDSKLRVYVEQSNLFSEYVDVNELISVVALSLKENDQFEKVQVINGRLILSVTSESATEFLTRFSQLKGVENAKFSQAISRGGINNKYEKFSIEFNLTSGVKK